MEQQDLRHDEAGAEPGTGAEQADSRCCCRASRVLLVLAEVALVLVILGLLAANWVPILVGARQFRAVQ